MQLNQYWKHELLHPSMMCDRELMFEKNHIKYCDNSKKGTQNDLTQTCAYRFFGNGSGCMSMLVCLECSW
jgi:hypothetical protein